MGAVLISGIAEAAIPNPWRHPATERGPAVYRKNIVFHRAIDFSRGIDATCIQPVESIHTTQEDIARIIPNNMSPTNSEGLVATQILDHSLSNWFNSEAVKRSTIGRTAKQIERTMESDLSFGGEQPESIKHSVKFSMRAAQTRADLEYSGLTKAQITYFIAQARTNIEIREDVALIGTELVYNHVSSPEDTRQTVSMRWNW